MKPTLEQIKSHFKDAITVEDSWGDKSNYDESRIYGNEANGFYIFNENEVDTILWSETNGFAKIIKTK